MTDFNNEFYVGGGGTQIVIDNSFKLNGSNWTSLGLFQPYSINSMKVFNGNLYVAGGFTNAAGIPCSRIAKFSETNDIEKNIKSNIFNCFPNPVLSTVTVSTKEIDKIILYNLLGAIVKIYKVDNSNSTIINIEDLSKGFYLIQGFNNNEMKFSNKIFKQ